MPALSTEYAREGFRPLCRAGRSQRTFPLKQTALDNTAATVRPVLVGQALSARREQYVSVHKFGRRIARQHYLGVDDTALFFVGFPFAVILA